MNFPIPMLLGVSFGLSEAGLAVVKRSRDDSIDADRSTVFLLWITISAAITAGIIASHRIPAAALGARQALFWTGCALFAAGIVLRWYSILYLGRFFTVNVAIHSRHEIIDTGPYRHIRHPSYSGALLAVLGLALCLANWASLLLIMVPILAAFAHRMSIEEAALADAIGSPYTKYMQRTRRLAPYLY